MRIPLLSIVIPTRGRPQHLPRAVASALKCTADDVETIVVPNGLDESWRNSLEPWLSDERVRVLPIEVANANVARNHGMRHARGKYLRFLDDDDYLYPEAQAQYAALDRSNHDVSEGGVDLATSDGNVFRQWTPVAVEDLAVTMLSPTRITHNCALLWRRSSLIGCEWDPACALGQDTAWVLGVARDKELSLLGFDAQTGVWMHHDGDRTSKRARPLEHNQATADILLNTIIGLRGRSALTDQRLAAGVKGLWQCIHNAFPLAPWYWSRVIRKVLTLAPDSRPPDPIFTESALRHLGPSLIEWLMAPHRLVRFHLRERARAKGLLPPW